MVRAPVMWNYPARTATEGFQDCATYQIAGLEPLSLSALAHVQGILLKKVPSPLIVSLQGVFWDQEISMTVSDDT